MKIKPADFFFISLIVLLIDCIVYGQTQNILYRNILLVVAYLFMGLSVLKIIIDVIKENRS